MANNWRGEGMKLAQFCSFGVNPYVLNWICSNLYPKPNTATKRHLFARCFFVQGQQPKRPYPARVWSFSIFWAKKYRRSVNWKKWWFQNPHESRSMENGFGTTSLSPELHTRLFCVWWCPWCSVSLLLLPRMSGPKQKKSCRMSITRYCWFPR